MAASRGDLGIFRARPGRLGRRVVARARRTRAARRSSRGCPSSSGPDHPAGTPVFVISKPLDRRGRARRGALCRPVRALAQGRRRGRSTGLGGEVVGERRPTRAASPNSIAVARRRRARRACSGGALIEAGREPSTQLVEIGSHARTFPREMSRCRTCARASRDRDLTTLTRNSRSMAARPAAPSRHDADRRLCARQERAPRASPRSTSSPRTRRRSARARRRSRPSARVEPSRTLSGRRRPPRCARRSPRNYGLDPARIVCGAGSDELLSPDRPRLCRARATRAIFTEHGFLVYRIAILAAGGTPVVAPETDLHRRRRRDPRAR